MKKSYPDLCKEFDATVIEGAKLCSHIDSLAHSIKKRGIPLAYKKALTYIDQVVWSPRTEAWLLVQSVQQRKQDVAVEVIAVTNAAVRRIVYHLYGPNEDFLGEEPAEFPEHFQACFTAVMKDCAKYFRQYREERNAKSAAAVIATTSTGSDKASQK